MDMDVMAARAMGEYPGVRLPAPEQTLFEQYIDFTIEQNINPKANRADIPTSDVHSLHVL